MSNPPKNKRTKYNTIQQANRNSLAVIVLDVSPLAWGEHDVKRKALDRARQAAGKSSMGPAILEEVLQSVVALCNCVVSLERSSALIIFAVANNECATVFPRKDQLAHWMVGSYTPNTQQISELLITGVAELLTRVVMSDNTQNPDSRQAAMAAAFSSALCLLNRMMVVARAGGVSALQQPHYLERAEDEGVVAMMETSASSNYNSSRHANSKSAWSPRILLIQASEDRARDYNAFMNCAFAAKKENITVDGCFLTASTNPKDPTTSSSSRFLEQVCDLTGGVYSAPSGMAQVGGALTQVLLSVFLAPVPCRTVLNLPALNKVDFRARCFETGATVDQAYVCNLCLSIFRNRPSGTYCPTCQAKIVADPTRRKSI
jgi:transcription initiation factor TFIIH subunit 3